MANRIKPLRRTGSTGQPNIALMEEGEIAVNSYDQKIWMRVGSNLIEIGNASAPTWGEVTGKPSTFPPSSHTHTKSQVGLGNVDNTSDANKPVSSDMQAALDMKANTSSPTFSGPVQSVGTSIAGSAIEVRRDSASGGGPAIRLEHTGNDFDRGLGISNDNRLIFGDWADVSRMSTSWDTVWHSGNFDPDDYLPRSGGTLTGQLVFPDTNSRVRFLAERTNSTFNANYGAKTSGGFTTFGRGNDTHIFAVGEGENANLNNAGPRLFSVSSTDAYVQNNPIWHSGNFDPDSKAPVENPVFEGDLTVSTSQASGGVIVERRNQPYNSSIEYKTTDGSIWAGYGNNGTIGFSVGGSSNLTGSNTWFKAQEGAAYIWEGSSPREVYHEGNLSVSGFVQQPGGSWYTDVTSTASQDSLALRFQTPSHTRYFGMGNDGTLRTSTSNQFSTGDLILTSGNQTSVGGNKEWTGSHTFYGSSANRLTIERATDSNSVITAAGAGGSQVVFGKGGSGDRFSVGNNLNQQTASRRWFEVTESASRFRTNLTVDGTVSATNLTATSDPRLKDDIKKVKARRELIEKLEYWSFEWKKDGTKGRSVMADKVQEIAPEHVHVADDEMGTLSVDKGALALEMVFALIEKLKEDGITN